MFLLRQINECFAKRCLYSDQSLRLVLVHPISAYPGNRGKVKNSNSDELLVVSVQSGASTPIILSPGISGKSFSIEQITDAISKILDKSIKLKSKNIIRKNEILDLFADIKKVSSAFNWQPKFSIYEGISDYNEL